LKSCMQFIYSDNDKPTDSFVVILRVELDRLRFFYFLFFIFYFWNKIT
jgi:hypothetical protein